MGNPDQEKWDRRYRDSDIQPKACSVLRDNLHLLPKTGKALDLACGLGGNALLLARQGLETEAWDISPVAIAKLNQTINDLPLTTKLIDIKADSLPAETFDVIVISYYLDRELAPAIIDALKPGGLLFYQTFNQNQLGRGPNNPAYRLKEKELPNLYAALKTVYYHEPPEHDETQLIAQK